MKMTKSEYSLENVMKVLGERISDHSDCNSGLSVKILYYGERNQVNEFIDKFIFELIKAKRSSPPHPSSIPSTSIVQINDEDTSNRIFLSPRNLEREMKVMKEMMMNSTKSSKRIEELASNNTGDKLRGEANMNQLFKEIRSKQEKKWIAEIERYKVFDEIVFTPSEGKPADKLREYMKVRFLGRSSLNSKIQSIFSFICNPEIVRTHRCPNYNEFRDALSSLSPSSNNTLVELKSHFSRKGDRPLLPNEEFGKILKFFHFFDKFKNDAGKNIFLEDDAVRRSIYDRYNRWKRTTQNANGRGKDQDDDDFSSQENQVDGD